jgi:GDP-D-mannose dehydratase
LICGINGQDGSYLADLLLKKGMKFLELQEMCRALLFQITKHWKLKKPNPLFVDGP